MSRTSSLGSEAWATEIRHSCKALTAREGCRGNKLPGEGTEKLKNQGSQRSAESTPEASQIPERKERDLQPRRSTSITGFCPGAEKKKKKKKKQGTCAEMSVEDARLPWRGLRVLFVIMGCLRD